MPTRPRSWSPRRPRTPSPQRPVSYAELDRLSDRWAARLAAAGVVHGAFVALLLPRSLDLIVGMLAILKAGAAYVPITPAMPPAAVRRILDHSAAAAILTRSGLAEGATPEGLTVITMDGVADGAPDAVAPVVEATGADPAYVIYTSGSTGAPKGVVVPQRGVSRLVLATDFTPLDATRVLMLLAPVSFDISMFEIWGALLNGGTLVVRPGISCRSCRAWATS